MDQAYDGIKKAYPQNSLVHGKLRGSSLIDEQIEKILPI